MVVVQPRVTPEDIERMLRNNEIGRDVEFELVDGEIVWLTAPKGHDHSRIVAIMIHLLWPFAEGIGAWLLGESAAYLVGPDLQNLRLPDVSLLTKERQHAFPKERFWATGAPDLVVEVLTPGEHGEPYARRKVPEYLSAGAKVVWLLNPDNRTVREYEPGRPDFRIYTGDAEITLDQIAPGFRAPISSFFPE